MMAKETYVFEDFLMSVAPEQIDFVKSLHDWLSAEGCKIKIELAKAGYVVSYSFNKAVIFNYVFRKKGLIMRIYGDNINQYEDILGRLPQSMVKDIEKSPICRRLHDPQKCNSRCKMGHIFTVNDTEHKKCRYNSFMFLVNDENNDYLKEFIENEIKFRAA